MCLLHRRNLLALREEFKGLEAVILDLQQMPLGHKSRVCCDDLSFDIRWLAFAGVLVLHWRGLCVCVWTDLLLICFF